MATRAINLKLIVSRTGERSEAKVLWVTHREVNHATRHYEELLLAMRQRPYLLGTDQVDAATAVEAARRLISEALERPTTRP